MCCRDNTYVIDLLESKTALRSCVYFLVLGLQVVTSAAQIDEPEIHYQYKTSD